MKLFWNVKGGGGEGGRGRGVIEYYRVVMECYGFVTEFYKICFVMVYTATLINTTNYLFFQICRHLRTKFVFITKTRLYNFDPFKPHMYIAKLGFTGVYIIFLISAQKHRLWVLVRTASARRF